MIVNLVVLCLGILGFGFFYSSNTISDPALLAGQYLAYALLLWLVFAAIFLRKRSAKINSIAFIAIYASLFVGGLTAVGQQKQQAVKAISSVVELGRRCTFSVSRLWSEQEVGWDLPEGVKEIVVDFEAKQYIGKEVVFDVAYVRSKRKTSLDGAEREAVDQLSSQPGISDFRYDCSNYSLPRATAKRCLMTYQKERLTMYYQSLLVVPLNDPYAAYTFTGGYYKPYSKEVIDKIFASVKCQ